MPSSGELSQVYEQSLPAGLPLGVLGVEVNEASVESPPDPAADPREYLRFIDRLPTEQRDVAIRKVRALRDVTGLGFSDEATAINNAVVQLIHEGTTEQDARKIALAKDLLTPSYWDLVALSPQVVHLKTSEEERQHVNDVLIDLHQQKVEEYRAQLADCGFDLHDPQDNETLGMLQDSLIEVEAARTVPAAFWKTFPTLPYAAQQLFLKSGEHLGSAARGLQVLIAHNMLDTVDKTLPTMALLDGPEAMEHYVQSLQQAQEKLGDSEADDLIGRIEYFADPLEAARLDKQLGITSSKLCWILTESYDTRPIVIEPGIRTLLLEMHTLLAGNPSEVEQLTSIRKHVTSADNPETYRAQLVEALTPFKGVGGNETVSIITDHDQPLEIARLLQPYASRITGLPVKVKLLIGYDLQRPNTSPDYLGHFFDYLDHAASRGLPLDEEAIKFIYLYTPKRQDNRWEEAKRSLDSEIDRHHIESFVNDDLQKALALLAEGKVAPRAELKDAPEIAAIFEHIGVPDQMANKLFRAWTSFSAAGEALEALAKELPKGAEPQLEDLNERHWKIGIDAKINAVSAQCRALRIYVNRYGLEETKEQHETFGTTNFVRTLPEYLHDQLERWKSSEAPKHIAAVSAGDHNNALSRFGNDVIHLLGEEGTFVFEFHNKAALAKHMVAVGNRDRAQGRNPQLKPTVDIVMIGGHGSPTSIEAGPDEDLDVKDYILAAQKRAKLAAAGGQPNQRRPIPNDYSRHLGNKYRTVFIACSVAGEVTEGQNLSQTMSEAHNSVTHGSPLPIVGMVQISPEGEFVYTHTVGEDPQRLLAQVYVPTKKAEQASAAKPV